MTGAIACPDLPTDDDLERLGDLDRGLAGCDGCELFPAEATLPPLPSRVPADPALDPAEDEATEATREFAYRPRRTASAATLDLSLGGNLEEVALGVSDRDRCCALALPLSPDDDEAEVPLTPLPLRCWVDWRFLIIGC